MPVAMEERRAIDHPTEVADLMKRDRPLVIRGLCANWPLVKMAEQSDTVFAQGLATMDSGADVDTLLMPPDQEGIIGYSADMDGFNYAHHRVSITQCLQRLAIYSRQANAPGLATQSALIAACLPNFLDSHALPFLGPEVQPRIWIGNKVTTPAHFDEFHNVACVIAGGRRFTLFAPGQVADLYVGPLDFAPTGAAIGMARLDRPDDPRYPRLKHALAQAQTAELRPGDAIYIPPMWWHHVESLQRINALVNYWWKSASASAPMPATALGCLMHCILTFRSLPEAERRHWKNLLDHYVFDEADPAAHIPPDRRGMLGTLSPELVASLRESIRRYL